MSSTPHHDAADNVGVLPGLPGSDTAAGSGPAVPELFAGLLDDGSLRQSPDHVPEHALDRGEGAVAAYLARAAAGYADVVSALIVPTAGCGRATADLDALTRPPGRATVLYVVVEADADEADRADRADGADPLADAAAAATALDARDDVRVVALSVVLPEPGDAAAALDLAGRLALATPRDGVRVWVQLPAGPGRTAALDVLARAGEGVGVCLPVGAPAAPPPEDLAAALRACVDAEVAVRLTGGSAPAVRGAGPATGPADHGVLNVLGAMRAALNGAEVPQVAEVLASTDAAALASGARRVSEADAAVLRAFLAGWAVPDVRVPVTGLVALGLLPAG